MLEKKSVSHLDCGTIVDHINGLQCDIQKNKLLYIAVIEFICLAIYT